MVALVIGKNGKRIKNLVYHTHTKIVVSQPIIGLTQRAVTIKGYYKDIGNSIYQIHKIMEEKAYLVDQYEFEPEIVNLDKIEIEARLVFYKEVASSFMDEKLDTICNNNNVKFNLKKPIHNDNVLSQSERVVILKGMMHDIET